MAKKDKSDKKKKSGKLKVASKDEMLVVSHLPVKSMLGMAMTQAARSFRTVQTRGLMQCGLYAGQEGVVLLLAAENGLTTGHLAQKLGVKAPTMTRTIGRMEAQGFLERRGSDTDARLTRVYLTEMGQATVERIAAANAAAEDLATQGMSNKEIRLLLKLLTEMDRNLHGVAAEPVQDLEAEPE
ncbi:MarR family transcriptional regulator [Rhizobium sp.]|jgi:DNA-binding MarR family transcriptional regulator|uniref:MarR family winged helix-turn-helix transcriptional regulator n=1 Tax=Rhizobium sp. TaxID=391 RepID=UPI000E8C5DD7|nr:MarR family transcriptional regulator [Rhizobium sp.]